MGKRRRLFTPTNLQILVGLADGKTQADIASELGLEQPAVSKRLRSLEEKVGSAFVRHSRHRMRLTSSGRGLANAAQVLLAMLDRFEETGVERQEPCERFVRLIACSTPGSYVLPGVVGEFIRSAPDVKVEFEVRPLTQLWRTFHRDTYDFAVVPNPWLPLGVTAETLYDDPFVIFAHPSHRLAPTDSVTLGDLRQETLIGRFEAEASYWQTIFQERSIGSSDCANHIELGSVEGVKRMVGTGLGIGVLFESSVSREIREGQFRRLKVPGVSLNRPFCLARRTGRKQAPDAERFGAFIVNHFAARA